MRSLRFWLWRGGDGFLSSRGCVHCGAHSKRSSHCACVAAQMLSTYEVLFGSGGEGGDGRRSRRRTVTRQGRRWCQGWWRGRRPVVRQRRRWRPRRWQRGRRCGRAARAASNQGCWETCRHSGIKTELIRSRLQSRSGPHPKHRVGGRQRRPSGKAASGCRFR